MLNRILTDCVGRMFSHIHGFLYRAFYRFFHPRRFKQLQIFRQQSLTEFDRYKCIFVHVPKCAGMSVAVSLFGEFRGHRTLETYRLMFRPREFNEYYKFAIVRNPWDRLVSAFLFMKKGGRTAEDREWAELNLAPFRDFESFVKEWVNKKNIGTYLHFHPQVDFICARNGLSGLDYVGHYENLKEDFACIRDRLGIKAELLKLNVNRSSNGDYTKYYTTETAQIVAEVYANDIELLGYSFGSSAPGSVSR
jgi:hypothetical protein